MYIILDGISQSNFKGKLQSPEPVQNFSTIYQYQLVSTKKHAGEE